MSSLKVRSLVIAAFLLLITAPQAMALEIQINSQGQIVFYNDAVLGEADERPQKVETPSPNKETKSAPVLKKINTTEQKRLRIEKGVPNKVEVEKRILPIKGSDNKGAFKTQEVTETGRLKVTFPARQNEKEIERREALDTPKPNVEAEDFNAAKLESADQDLMEKDLSKTEAEKNQINAFKAQVKLQRSQRDAESEQVELEAGMLTGDADFNLKSRGVTAKIDGKQVLFDPSTNQLILIKANGEEKVLTTLPDQALSRMREVGAISPEVTPTEGQPELTLETTADGQVAYSTQAVAEKRVFGLGFLKRSIRTKVELNAETGEVAQTPVLSNSAWGRFLDRFSQ